MAHLELRLIQDHHVSQEGTALKELTVYVKKLRLSHEIRVVDILQYTGVGILKEVIDSFTVIKKPFLITFYKSEGFLN